MKETQKLIETLANNVEKVIVGYGTDYEIKFT